MRIVWGVILPIIKFGNILYQSLKANTPDFINFQT